ncbi:MAG: hypothetical protein L0Z70_10685, partial [Chloroflexi bacterium]|nr:hypothetical protein [Chloroflexota bacterium]
MDDRARVPWKSKRGEWPRALLVAAVYLIACLALESIAAHFQDEHAVSPWYLPAGLHLALLTVMGFRYAPLIALETFLAEQLVWRTGGSAATLLLFSAAIPVSYLLAALALRYPQRKPFRLNS